LESTRARDVPMAVKNEPQICRNRCVVPVARCNSIESHCRMVKGADKSVGIGSERDPSIPDGRSGQTSFIGCLVNNKTLLSLIFLEVRIMKDFKSTKFGSADSARVTDRFRGSADSKGVSDW
jgi:hypothetical protein